MFDRAKKTHLIGAKVTQEEYNIINEFAKEFNISISNIIIHGVAENMARRVVEKNGKNKEAKNDEL